MSEKKHSRNVTDPMRVLKVLQVLKRHSDSNNRLKQSDIMEWLAKDKDIDYSCDSKTLSKALRELIAVLNPPRLDENNREDFVIRYKGWENGIPERLTDIYCKPKIGAFELLAIADGIRCTDTLSLESKKALIDKLKDEYPRIDLKTDGLSLFSVDDGKTAAENTAVIQKAADKCVVISFNFGGYDKDGNVVPRRGSGGEPKLYRAVPYYVVKYGGRRYMLCCYLHSDGKFDDSVSIFRVDLMSNIKLTDKPGKLINNVRELINTNALEYMLKHPAMTYGGPMTTFIKLNRNYYTLLHDCFGENYECIRPLEGEYDEVRLMSSEKGIIDLALAYPDRLEILRPEWLRKKLIQRLYLLKSKYDSISRYKKQLLADFSQAWKKLSPKQKGLFKNPEYWGFTKEEHDRAKPFKTQYTGFIFWIRLPLREPVEYNGKTVKGLHLMPYRITQDDVDKAEPKDKAGFGYKVYEDPGYVDYDKGSGNCHKLPEGRYQAVLCDKDASPWGPGKNGFPDMYFPAKGGDLTALKCIQNAINAIEEQRVIE